MIEKCYKFPYIGELAEKIGRAIEIEIIEVFESNKKNDFVIIKFDVINGVECGYNYALILKDTYKALGNKIKISPKVTETGITVLKQI